MDFGEIKLESSELEYDLESDIKYEENVVPILFPVLKSEVEVSFIVSEVVYTL